MNAIAGSRATKAYVFLFLCGCLWAGNAIAGKLAVGHVSPFALTFGRWLIAVVIIAPFAIPHVRKEWQTVRANIVFLTMLGLFGFTLFNNLLYTALKYTSAINVSIEQASLPLTVFLFSFLLFGERATWNQLAGFAATLLGVLVAVTRGDLTAILELDLNIGDLFMLLAISIYGIYSVLLGRKPDIHWLTFIFVLGTAACIAAIPFLVYEILTGAFIFPDAQGWAVVVYAGIGPSILAQVFWMIGLSEIGANRGGVFINFVPIITAILAVFILGETFEVFHAIAMVLVMFGVFYAQRSKRNTTKKA